MLAIYSLNRHDTNVLNVYKYYWNDNLVFYMTSINRGPKNVKIERA